MIVKLLSDYDCQPAYSYDKFLCMDCAPAHPATTVFDCTIRDSRFTFPRRLWYGSRMLQAFVGIVSHQGIELFCPEDPSTVRFLLRRAARASRPMACFWSVLTQEAAALIDATLDLGQSADALELLLQLAHECGLVSHHEQPASDCCDAYPA
jgi:hypothetical protein